MPYGDEKSYSFFKMKGTPMKRNFGIEKESPTKHLTGKHPGKDGHTWGSHVKETAKFALFPGHANPVDPGKPKKHTVKKISKYLKGLKKKK